MFNILPEFVEGYRYYLNEGKQFAKEVDIGVVGLCRNVDSVLETNINNLNNFFNEYFKSSAYFIYENDSDDGTKDTLKNLSRKIKTFKYKSENLGRQHYGAVKDYTRTQRLAEYRNRCLDHVENKFKKQNYILVLDLDFASFNPEGFLNSFGWFKHNPVVDGMAGFNFEIKRVQGPENELWNYDCWAYRPNHWSDPQLFLNPGQTSNPVLWFGLWIPYIGSPPVNVNSAFGGSCIYKKDRILGCRYKGDTDCEHVLFHKELKEKNKFNLFVNPSQVMIVPTVHHPAPPKPAKTSLSSSVE